MKNTNAAVLVITLLLCLVPVQLYAQAPVSRVFTLDETMSALYSEGNFDPDGSRRQVPQDGKAERKFHWDPFFQEGSFTIEGHYGIFSTAPQAGDTGFLMIDNRDIYSVPLPYINKGELVFPEPFVTAAKEAFARSISEDTSHYRIAAIIIDAGHGGKNTGAVSEQTINGKKQKIIEKDITLNASKMLKDMLIKAYPDKRVLMTRENDITMSLEERTLIANSVPIRKNEAIIYVSIHANSVTDSRARGYEVWYLNPEYRRTVLDKSHFSDSPELRQIMNMLTEEAFTTESIKIAQSILDALKATMGATMPSRGLKAEEFFVVRRSNMPAVLVELGFVSNREDAVLMTNDVHLHKLVEAVYKGIADFVGAFERSGGFIAAR